MREDEEGAGGKEELGGAEGVEDQYAARDLEIQGDNGAMWSRMVKEAQ